MLIISLILFLILITILDCKTKIIPDGLSLLGIIAILHYQYYAGNIWQALLGIDMGIGIVWIMNCLRLNSLGGGDAKLMALIGSVMGWQVILAVALLAWVIFLPFKYKLKQKKVAYSPFIFVAFIISLIFKKIIYG